MRHERDGMCVISAMLLLISSYTSTDIVGASTSFNGTGGEGVVVAAEEEEEEKRRRLNTLRMYQCLMRRNGVNLNL
ncbi:MAG: hypothetical protein NZ888_02740 [Candidatus Nitrosocaldus sp.]|nr:hypothetical protein [Candidatus Nitrosocaldus sp.]MDW8000050.1 hypothetical protein [Candidatus Nitrosocaldus sp.]